MYGVTIYKTIPADQSVATVRCGAPGLRRTGKATSLVCLEDMNMTRHYAAILLVCSLFLPAWAAAQDLAIESMTMERTGDAETFCITFSGEYIPEAKSLEDGNLRVYFDVWGLSNAPKTDAPETAGTMITSVRTGYDTGEKRLRVVLDLAATGDYRVAQRYFEKTDRFCLSVRPQSPASR